jgi:transcription initiation factor TFIIF subunit alpha
MNGAPTPLATAASTAIPSRPTSSTSPATMAGSTPTVANGKPRRKRPRETNPLRKPIRPLDRISKPRMSSTQLQQTGRENENSPAAHTGGNASADNFRHEFLQKGARSIPLVATRAALKQLRHHVMRLQSKEEVDVQDEDQFTPPIRLHRRDPRAPPSGAGSHIEPEETTEDIEESKERERQEIAREERRKVREENQAKIAPTGTKKPPAFQKKTEQKYRDDNTPAAKKRQLLRYEETLPWHLEDFENKQTWTGTYESEMSETHLMLTSDTQNAHGQVIQIAPLERWYRFNPKTKAKSTEDPKLAEMKAKKKQGGYFTKLEEKSKLKLLAEEDSKIARGIRTRIGGGQDDEGRIRRAKDDDDMPVIKREADADDIDFNLEEDFADDEEGLNGLFEGEDVDVKEAEEKVKREQLGAAAFDLRNEIEIYREEEEAAKAEETAKLLEKALRKSLVKREKNIDYETDDDNPYASTSSEDTDSETERQRAKEEQEKKAAEGATEQNGKAAEGERLASGASTKGATTPSGSHRSNDVNKKKRPGSPNLSEASGNESTRKKHKKKHGDGSRKSSLAHLRGGASGSDSEMTDAGKTKKPKLKVRLGGSPDGSPAGSRAGSPAVGVNGSRAGSPAAASREFLLFIVMMVLHLLT